jgi:hypothetical protein
MPSDSKYKLRELISRRMPFGDAFDLLQQGEVKWNPALIGDPMDHEISRTHRYQEAATSPGRRLVMIANFHAARVSLALMRGNHLLKELSEGRCCDDPFSSFFS